MTTYYDQSEVNAAQTELAAAQAALATLTTYWADDINASFMRAARTEALDRVWAAQHRIGDLGAARRARMV